MADSWGICIWCGRGTETSRGCWCGHQMVYYQSGTWQRAGNGERKLGWGTPAYLMPSRYLGYTQLRRTGVNP